MQEVEISIKTAVHFLINNFLAKENIMPVILIANNSGNVGKTTLANHLFLPRLNNPTIIHVESNNHTEGKGEKLTSLEFSKIFDRIFDATGDVIIDVGSSNIEGFLKIISTDFEEAISFFDYVIIPVVPSEKEQIDAVTTATQFELMGVPEKNIKFIFNKFDSDFEIEEQYSTFLNSKKIKISSVPVVKDSTKFFNSLIEKNIKYADLASDKRNLTELIASATNIEQKAEYRRAVFYRHGYNSYHKGLDEAYKVLNLKG